jgi:hypothetical protein
MKEALHCRLHQLLFHVWPLINSWENTEEGLNYFYFLYRSLITEYCSAKFHAEYIVSDIPHWLYPSQSICRAPDNAILFTSLCLWEPCNEALYVRHVLIDCRAKAHKDDVSIKVVEFRVSEAINSDDIKKDLSRLNSLLLLLWKPFVVKSPQTSFTGRGNKNCVTQPLSCGAVCSHYTCSKK